jgi:hypothetical protein
MHLTANQGYSKETSGFDSRALGHGRLGHVAGPLRLKRNNAKAFQRSTRWPIADEVC